jgi:hypothetical protein
MLKLHTIATGASDEKYEIYMEEIGALHRLEIK